MEKILTLIRSEIDKKMGESMIQQHEHKNLFQADVKQIEAGALWEIYKKIRELK